MTHMGLQPGLKRFDYRTPLLGDLSKLTRKNLKKILTRVPNRGRIPSLPTSGCIKVFIKVSLNWYPAAKVCFREAVGCPNPFIKAGY